MPDLMFDEALHIFTLDGRRIASVTQILKHFIPRWNCDLFYLERGTAVHKATELYDKGTLDMNSVDPQIEGYLQAWIKFREDYRFIPSWIERQAYHPVFLYAGIIDRIGDCKEGNCILDIKSSGTQSKFDLLQLAGYSCLVSAPKTLNIYLQEDGRYKVKIYTPKELGEAKNVFLSMVTIWNFLINKGIISWNNT